MDSVRRAERDVARFWAKIDKNGPIVRPEIGPCWLWTAALFDRGYGAFRLDGQQRRAHVVSYKWHVGPVPEGLSVLHCCDVRRCIRPDHLFVGTQKDNIQDAISKGRMANGTRNGMYVQDLTTLTDIQVQRIHQLAAQGGRHSDIADQFGISQPMVSRIARGDAWRHLGLAPIRRAILSLEDVREIRRLCAQGERHSTVAARYGISKNAVGHIHRRYTWRHVV